MISSEDFGDRKFEGYEKETGTSDAMGNHSHLFVFSNTKAGMNENDKDRQSKIVYDMSKNSAYFERAQNLDKKNSERIRKMKDAITRISDSEMESSKQIIQQSLLNIELKRNLRSICCVLDMDMFFAAVELRDQPHLKDKPIAVGGMSMIGTSNYVARKYGVRAAMPGFIARKLCPDLIFISPHFEKYEAVSKQVKDIIAEYDPDFKSWSLDEVYFDLTKVSYQRFQEKTKNVSTPLIDVPIEELRDVANTVAHEIRNRIKNVTCGLTCSAGIANNFFLSKICADINKPDGQYELPPNRSDILAFLETLPTRKVGGIGKVMEKTLSDLGMHTMGDVKNNLHVINLVMTPITANYLIRTSVGISEEELGESNLSKSEQPFGINRKSIGAERTFSAISAPEELRAKLKEISVIVAGDLDREGLVGHCITLKLKTVKFELHTRSVSSTKPMNLAADIERLSLPLLNSMMPIEIRLLGISVSKLEKQGYRDSILAKRGFVKISSTASKEDGEEITKPQQTFLRCPSCQDSFQNLANLNSHLDVCLSESQQNDSSCSSIQLSSEVYLAQSSENTTSSASSNLKTAEFISVFETYECPICNVKFANVGDLNLHIDDCLNKSTEARDRNSSSTSSKILKLPLQSCGKSKSKKDLQIGRSSSTKKQILMDQYLKSIR